MSFHSSVVIIIIPNLFIKTACAYPIPFGGVVVTDPKKADISRQNRYVLLRGYEHSNPHKLWRTSMPYHCGEGEFPKMYYWSSLWTNTVTVRKWMSLHVLNGNSPSNQFHGIVAERITNLWGPDRRRSDDIPPRWWLVPSPSPLKRFSRLTWSHSALFNLYGSEYSISDKHPEIPSIMVPDWIKRQNSYNAGLSWIDTAKVLKWCRGRAVEK